MRWRRVTEDAPVAEAMSGYVESLAMRQAYSIQLQPQPQHQHRHQHQHQHRLQLQRPPQERILLLQL